jgi:L-lactate dehydrogenase complex protein LldG
MNPDEIAEASALNGTDLGVVEGVLAVAENGCVWVPQTMKERAVLFISERLIIIVDGNDIVNNMHEAYSRIQMPDYGYGCFISGPSKTADIAQALVMGAQAARDVTVIIR